MDSSVLTNFTKVMCLLADGEILVVKLPSNRPKSPRNKRWFQIGDFGVLFDFIEHELSREMQ